MEKKDSLFLDYTMELDTRGLGPKELFRKLRDMLSSCGSNELVEVLVYDQTTANKVQMFAAMSRCPVEVEKRDHLFIVRITENTCGCSW